MKRVVIISAVLVLVAFIVAGSSMYVVHEGEQAVITQFGKPIRAVTAAGLYFKAPLIQEVHRLDARLLPWDGEPQDMPTKDKRRIYIDVWARWRIVDPMKYFKVVGTERSGMQRLDELVDSAVRSVIASNNLIDAVRTTDDPLEYESEELAKEWAARRDRVSNGRAELEAQIRRQAGESMTDTFGMELVDVRIKRIDYVENVREKVYERMRSERMRIASLFESEAEEERNRILGATKKELDEIEGDMMKRSAEIRGEADAKVIEITAAAYGQDPHFYAFLRQLEGYRETLGRGTRLILSTENPFLKQLASPTMANPTAGETSVAASEER